MDFLYKIYGKFGENYNADLYGVCTDLETARKLAKYIIAQSKRKEDNRFTGIELVYIKVIRPNMLVDGEVISAYHISGKRFSRKELVCIY